MLIDTFKKLKSLIDSADTEHLVSHPEFDAVAKNLLEHGSTATDTEEMMDLVWVLANHELWVQDGFIVHEPYLRAGDYQIWQAGQWVDTNAFTKPR